MFSSNTLSPADVALLSGRDGNNMFGEGGLFFFLWAMLLGFGRGGFGGYGQDAQVATSADLQRGFNNQEVINKLNGLENAFAQTGYDNAQLIAGVNQNVTNNGFNTLRAIDQNGFNLQQAVNSLQALIQQCCCTTQRSIDGVKYDMSQGFCNLGNTIQQVGRDIIDNQNANYRAMHDEFFAARMEDKNARIHELESQVQALNLAQSQSNQNNYLLSQLSPQAKPAYLVPNPCYQSCQQCW